VKKIFKKLKGIIAGILLLGLSLAPLGGAKAEGPRFNYLDGDHPLIYGLNLTKNETERKTAITGAAGDVFEVALYYHNGVVNTTAHNTRLKVSMPDQTTNKTGLFRTTLTADNADSISADMSISLGDEANFQFVPGTLKWFPNYKTGNLPSPFPSGENENNLFKDGGFNVGDVNGCWDFKGYLIFQVKTAKIVPGVIVRSKIAKNITTGESGVNIKANPGDIIEYRLSTKNVGKQLVNIQPYDDISDILEYSDIANVPQNAEVRNGVITFDTNLSTQSIAPGVSKVHTFKVKVKNPLPATPQSGFHFDYIMYNLYGNSVTVNLQKPVPGKPSVNLQKDVRNFTASETGFADENSAKPGDTLEYKISFKNSGSGSANSVKITDSLPLHTKFMSGTTILSMNDGQEKTVGDLLTGEGIVIGTLNPKDFGYIKFKVLTSASLANGEKLVNTANLKFDSVNLSDLATTKIVAQAATANPVTPIQPNLPKTGAESWIIALLLAPASYIVYTFLKRKKALKMKVANY